MKSHFKRLIWHYINATGLISFILMFNRTYHPLYLFGLILMTLGMICFISEALIEDSNCRKRLK